MVARGGTRILRRRPRAPIGARTMLGAVRLVVRCPRPAEEEARRAGIADRPSAGIVGQFKKRAAPTARDIRVEASILDIGLGAHDPGRQRPFPVPVRRAISGCDLIQAANRLGCVPSARRAAEGRQIGDAEPVNLGDDGVGRDAVAQLRGDVRTRAPCDQRRRRYRVRALVQGEIRRDFGARSRTDVWNITPPLPRSAFNYI